MKAFAILAAACLAATNAQATFFTFSQTFDHGGVTVTGTFQGTLNGNIISDISSPYVYLNGIGLPENGALYLEHLIPGTGYVDGGATASLDGTANNFLFVSSDIATGGNPYTADFYFSITSRNRDEAVNYYGNQDGYSVPSGGFRAAVSDEAASVPEPASWALLIGGFGLMGAARRRKALAVSFAL